MRVEHITERAPRTVGLEGAAALLELTYDYLQRHWRELVDEAGFPTPYIGWRKRARPRWRADALEAWQTGARFEPSAPIYQDARDTPSTPASGTAEPEDYVAQLLRAAGG